MSDTERGGAAVPDEDEEPIFVTFDLGDLGGAISIRANDAKNWFKKELDWWSWTSSAVEPDASNFTNAARLHLKTVRRAVDPAIQSLEVNPSKDTAESLARQFERGFRDAKVFTQSTPQAGLIRELLAKDKMEAIGAATYFLGDPFATPMAAGILRGVLRAFAFEQGLSGAAELERQSLVALRSEWQQSLVDSIQSAAEQERSLAETLNLARDETKNVISSATEQAGKQAIDYAEFLENAKERLSTLERTFEAGLALKAPVSYWSAKRKFHRRKANVLMRWIGAFAIVSFLGLSFAAAHLLSGETGGALKLPLWHVAAFASAFGMFVWGARILVRMMLSNSHLEADAHERVVIANTYLALVRGGRLTEPSTEKVLEALLRHSPDGIVRDDALPYISDILRKNE